MKIREVLRSSEFQYAVGEISNGLTLLLFVVVARPLGVDQFGDFVAVFAASAILEAVVSFGFFPLLTREVARSPRTAPILLRQAIWRQLPVSLFALLGLYVYINVASLTGPAVWAGWLIGISFIVKAASQPLRGICRGLEWFHVESCFLVAERSMLLVASALVVLNGAGLVGLGWVFLIVRVVSIPVFWFALERSGEYPKEDDIGRPVSLGEAVPFAASDLLWNLYYQVDAALLKALSTARQTGLYGGMYRFYDILAVIPRLVAAVGFPRMSRAWVEDRALFLQLCAGYSRAVFMAMLPAVYLLICGSELALGLLFGREYIEVAPALSAVAVGAIFAGYGFLYEQVLQSSGQEALFAKVIGVAVAVNVGLNIVLIPDYGLWGATVATVATEAVLFVLLRWFLLSSGRLAEGGRRDSYLPIGLLALGVAFCSHLLGGYVHWIAIPIAGLAWMLAWRSGPSALVHLVTGEIVGNEEGT